MSNPIDKIYTYLGFAAKAHTLKAGEKNVLAFLKKKQVALLIISETASKNAIHRWTLTAKQFNAPYIIWGNQEALGKAIGSSHKTILALTDKRLAKHIESIFNENKT